MAATGRMDEMVKDYLLYRGFSATLKTLDAELKNDKDKGFRVDRVVELLNIYITNHDLTNLREYWQYLNHRLFCRLEQVYGNTLRKLETGLFKLYVVTALQNNKHDKVHEFFEKMASELHNQPEWKDWFILPFMRNPEDNQSFAMYFSRQWQETFYISLHNFFGVVFQCMATPSIMQFEQDQKKISKLQEENERYKQQIKMLLEKQELEEQFKLTNQDPSPLPTPGANSMDIMDDFYVISQDTSIPEKDVSKSSQLKSFIKNISLPSSPMSGKKATQIAKKAQSVNKGEVSKVKPDITSKDTPVRAKPEANLSNNSSAAHKTQAPPSGDPPTPPVSTARPTVDKAPRPVKDPAADTATAANNSTSKDKSVGHVTASSNSRVTSQADLDTANQSHSGGHLGGRSHGKDTGIPQFKAEVEPSLIPLGQEEYGEHHSSISHCRFSPGGHLVATSDVDGIVKVWSLQPSPVTLASIMSKSMFISLEWVARADRQVLLGNKQGYVKLFDVKDKKVVGEVSMDAAYQRISALACHPAATLFVCAAAGRTRTVTGPADPTTPRAGKLVMCDMKTMTITRTLPPATGGVAVNCIAFNPTGQRFVTGGADGVIRLYDTQAQECISSWAGHQGEVYTVQFGVDGTSCYSMGSDSKFLRWNLHQPGHSMQELPIHPGACGPFVQLGVGGYRQVQTPKGRLFAFDGEGQHILTCGPQAGLIYKVVDKTLMRALCTGEHKTPIVCVDWSSALDCRMCLTASMDGKVRVSTLLAQ